MIYGFFWLQKIVAEILKKSGCKKFGLNLVGKKNRVKN